MARTIQRKWATAQTEDLLNLLIDKETNPESYKVAMYELGRELGEILLGEFRVEEKNVCIACTVEDADFLAKGVIDALEESGKNLFVTVFWNKRFKPFSANDIAVAPIIREFHEPDSKSATNLIVIKSIIASACVVATNLMSLIDQLVPNRIFIVAPVLLEGARENLAKEFTHETTSKFEYLYFAEDNERTADGMVVPGIGGEIYQRLGFAGQEGKNNYTPSLVKERRARANL